MAVEIFKLVGSIFVDNEKANKSISQTDEKAEGLGKKLLKGTGTALKWGAGLAAGAAAGATALFGMASNAAATTDEIDKMSQKIGISRTSYQEMAFACSQSGTDVNNLKAGLKTLTNQMESAQGGSKTASAAFEKLGLSIYDSNGNLKDQETMLFETLSALQNVENQTEKSALAVDLLGKSGTELMPMLNGASGSIDAMRQQAHDLGLVLNDEAIDSGVKFTDTVDQVKRSFGAVVTQIGVSVMPIIQKLLEWVLANMPMIQAVLGVVFDFINAGVTAVGDIISWLTGIFSEHMPQIQAFVKTAIDGISKFWQQVLKPCFKAISDFITNTLAPAFKTVFNNIILPVVKTVFNGIGTVWNTILKPIFSGIVTFLTGVFTGDWKKAFEGIVSIVKNVFGGLVSIVKAPINAVIKIINGFISGLNKLKIPDWVPLIGGKGINIPKIPLLAKGGTAYKGGTAIVGDAGPELLDLPAGARVTPLNRVNNSNMENEGLLKEILKLLSILVERKPEYKIYLNNDVLVGELIDLIDTRINQRYRNAERG